MFVTEISNSDSNTFPIQFVTGQVVDVIASRDHFLFKEMGNNKLYLNAIKATKSHDNTARTNKILSQAQSDIYIPLLRGVVDVPTRGDQVLLCSFGNVNYYLGPLNTINSPNFNPDLETEIDDSDVSTDILQLYNVSPGFIWNPNTVERSEKYPINILDQIGIESDLMDENFSADYPVGDLLFEGRHGNSIRIGQRSQLPYMMLSNNKLKGFGRETFEDETLIAMTSGTGLEGGEEGTLSHWFYSDDFAREDYVDTFPEFNLASNVDDNKRQISFQDEPIGQILINSNKITFNSKNSDFTISSIANVNIGSANNVKVYTNNSTIIESKNIYLGEESEKEEQPLVLGNELREILKDLTNAVMGLKTTANSPAMSGPPDPGTIGKLSTILGKLQTPEATPFLSKHHFIEKNKLGGK